MEAPEISELNELILRFLDGKAEDKDVAALDQLLGASREARRYYLRFLGIHIGLKRLLESGADSCEYGEATPADDTGIFREIIAQDLLEVSLRDNLAQWKANQDNFPAAVDQVTEEAPRPAPAKGWTRRQWLMGIMKLAAVFMAALGIIWLDGQLQHPSRRTPPVIATVTETMNAHWEPDRPFITGDALPTGPLKLLDGYAGIKFTSGAEVILQAPVEMVLDTDNMIYLQNGVLSAFVPDSAKGFMVQTPGAEIVDFGTEFGVKTRFRHSTEVQVFNGRVQAGLSGGAEDQKRQPVRRELFANQAVKIDVVNRQVSKIPFRQDIFVRQLEDASCFVNTEGQIYFRKNMPASLLVNSYESDREMFLFPEKQNIVLPRDIMVIEPETTGIQTTSLVEVRLLQNLEVSSYLLHIDKLCDDMGRAIVFQGRMRFNRPVLGIINQDDLLKETDAVFGLPGVYYESTHLRRSHPKTNAMFRLSEDRRTLEIVLFKVRNLDEWRILTAASPQGQPSVDQAGM